MPTTTSGPQQPPSPFFLFLFTHKVDFLLGIALILFVYAVTVPRQATTCTVTITGEAIRVVGCPDPGSVFTNLNIAPWNGVKFPILDFEN
ncbi:triple gene block protein 3 [Plantain virus X]|uniref:Movement protein TGBp3 n=1 Tax=Plantain virus X TaxID=1331744 RepID=A0A0S2ZX53_9VIRU|nr:triple gene block protein 3 [Plantain virus X]ALQ43529.1 triple gene block protein 3 [Plantain virus X]